MIADHPGGSGTLIHPKTVMSIRNLELRARVIVEGFWNGIHRSPFHGFSAEFTEYRQYTAGDDPRYVDWRVFARSDRYFIKKFEDETNLRCHLLVDQSRSMEFGSVGYTKAEYGATLSATLAYFLYLQGDAVGLLTFDDRLREYLAARNRSGHLRQLMLALSKPPTGAATDLKAPLKQIVQIVRKRGLVLMLSDFLAPIEMVESDLIALAACGHEVILFQILDPVEASFEFSSPAVFEDFESGRKLFIDPGTARREYMDKLEKHCKTLRDTCQRLGIAFHAVQTDQPLEVALFNFLRGRMGKKTGLKNRTFRSQPAASAATTR